jgi:fermentation-respiration switch protein FrsA (DUF1100 family)
MKKEVTFKSKDLICSGLFYLPEGATPTKKWPAIVMAHGMGSTKEMCLPQFAERFVDAGFAVLLFDYRFLGASEGTPRGQIFPAEQQEDYRNAITWMQLRPEIDSDRIGVWGTSYSSAHVLHVAAYERRIKCVVAQVPVVSGYQTIRRINSAIDFDSIQRLLANDRIHRYETGEIAYLPYYASDDQPHVLPNSGDYFERAKGDSDGRFENRITLESIEHFVYFEPTVNIDAISPTPLRMIVADRDLLAAPDLALAAYSRAHEPKSLVFLKGEHFDAYEGEGFKAASSAASDWFIEWLK